VLGDEEGHKREKNCPRGRSGGELWLRADWLFLPPGEKQRKLSFLLPYSIRCGHGIPPSLRHEGYLRRYSHRRGIQTLTRPSRGLTI